jgi:site-specific DNA recombinase
MSMPRRAVMYLRISLDQTGEGLAVARQRDECARIIKQRRWKLVGEYVDNSISASDTRKNRPGYDALLRAYDAGDFDALVCYDLDRLTRQPRQLEDWIDAAEGRGLALVTANGEADLSTDGGRIFARVKLAVARAEVDRKSRRQRDALSQRAKLGRPPLGVRLTGYSVRGEIVPDEAEVIRRVFKMFHAGETLRSISRALTDEGVASRSGRPWNPSTIRTILVNPRYAGRAVYQGRPTGELGNWEPLVSAEVFDLVQARLSDPRRVSNRVGTDCKHLGSGLYLCAVCDEPASSWSQGAIPLLGRAREPFAWANRRLRPNSDRCAAPAQ